MAKKEEVGPVEAEVEMDVKGFSAAEKKEYVAKVCAKQAPGMSPSKLNSSQFDRLHDAGRLGDLETVRAVLAEVK